MRKRLWVATLCFALVGGLAMVWSNATAAEDTDQVKIARLVNEMNSIGAPQLEAMEPIPIRQWEVPGPGVDVMRAKLEETYSVDGIGTDTVELTGWIAVRHGAPYPVEGAVDLNWNTAILDTEFIQMDLHGTSKIFGPVHVTLDRTRPSLGKVGRIEIPELAKHQLQAKLEKNESAAANQKLLARRNEKRKPTTTPTNTTGKSVTGGGSTRNTATDGSQDVPSTEDAAAACAAPVIAKVSMPNLGLEMVTAKAVTWYSLVDTIPPVGHTASIAVEPVRMVMNGREVGTLESGIVKFREVVRHVGLSSNDEQLAKQ
jgi:hypothetical protein